MKCHKNINMLFVAAVVGQLYEHLLPWSVSDTYWYIWLNNSLAWIHDTATCYFLHSFLRYLTRGPVLNGAVSGAVGHVREPEHDHCSARQPRLSLGLVKLWPGCFHKPWQVCQAVEMSLPSVAVRRALALTTVGHPTLLLLSPLAASCSAVDAAGVLQ